MKHLGRIRTLAVTGAALGGLALTAGPAHAAIAGFPAAPAAVRSAHGCYRITTTGYGPTQDAAENAAAGSRIMHPVPTPWVIRTPVPTPWVIRTPVPTPWVFHR
jgi:hypothetical protein